jgi:hypothetical protein
LAEYTVSELAQALTRASQKILWAWGVRGESQAAERKHSTVAIPT